MLDIQIATGNSAPIFRQICDQISKAVVAGRLTPGEQMPSVRALAERLVVNPNTVARAYGELTAAGVLESQRGKGLYVAATRRQMLSDDERRRRLAFAVETFLHEVRLLDFTPGEIVRAIESELTAAVGERSAT